MYKYKCKSVGDCSVANRGELITSDSLLNDPKCSECACAMDLIEEGSSSASGAGTAGSRTKLIAAVAGAVVVLAAGGAWYASGSKVQPIASVETPVAAPAAEPPETVHAAAGGIVPSESETSMARREADQKLSNGEFSAAEKKSARAAALEMIKTAVAKMGQGDLIGAENELMQARERDATEPLVYYNLAIVRLRQQQPEEAMKQLEAAFMAGFTFFDAMDKDTDLDALRALPKFKELLSIYRKGQ